MQLWNKRYSDEYLWCWRMVVIYPILPEKSTSTSSSWWLQSMSLRFLRRESIRPLDLQDTYVYSYVALRLSYQRNPHYTGDSGSLLMRDHFIQPLHIATFLASWLPLVLVSSEVEYPYFHAEQLVYKIMKRIRTSVPADSPTDSLQVWVSRWRKTHMSRLTPIWSFRSLDR